MRLELLPQVGHEVYGANGGLRFRYNPHYVHPHPERENEDQSVPYSLMKRELTLICVNFDQKNDYEWEKTVKIIREAKKVNEGTLGSVWN